MLDLNEAFVFLGRQPNPGRQIILKSKNYGTKVKMFKQVHECWWRGWVREKGVGVGVGVKSVCQ